MESKYKSKVVKAFFSDNYQVEFSIDHQTFRLEPVDGDPEYNMTSKEKAKWYKKQLDTAFKRILVPTKELKEIIAMQSDLLTLNENP